MCGIAAHVTSCTAVHISNEKNFFDDDSNEKADGIDATFFAQPETLAILSQ